MGRPFTIGIGGAHSDIGKTTFAAALLRGLSVSGDRPPAGNKRLLLYSLKIWGAVKYTKTAIHCSVTDNAGVLRRGDKDTARMLEAGATEVLWVQAPPEELEEVLPMVMERLSGLDGIIIEGNSAIEFLRPDIVIFISDPSGERFKPSATNIQKLADIIVFPWGLEDGTVFRTEDEHETKQTSAVSAGNPRTMTVNPLVEKEVEGLLDTLDEIAKKKNIEELLRERSSENRIPCGLARKIAEDLGVPYGEVGNAANELKIKIKNCELGCF